MLTYGALVHQIGGLGLDPVPPRRVSVSSQTLNNQIGTPGLAGGRGPGPSLGAAYLSPHDPPCQPGPQREGGM